MCEPECRNLPKKVFLVLRVRVCLLTAARLCSHWVCYSVRHQTNLEIYFYILSNLFSVGNGHIPDSIRSSPFWRHSVWGYFHQDLPPLASSRLQHLALAWSRHVTNWNRLDAMIYVFWNISDNALWTFLFSAIVQLSITFWWQLSFSSNFTWLGPLLWALAVYSWAAKRNIIFPSQLWRDSNLRQESKQARAGFTRLDSHGG